MRPTTWSASRPSAFRLEVQQQAMPQHGKRGRDPRRPVPDAPAVEQRGCFGAKQQRLTPARARAPLTHSRTGFGADGSSRPRGSHQSKGVVDDVGRGRHSRERAGEPARVPRRSTGATSGVCAVVVSRPGCAVHQRLLVADHDVEHEAVQLRFGQRMRAFLFDRILRRQHEQRPIERIADAADGDLNSCIASRRAACVLGASVDLVREDDVRELTRHEPHVPCLPVADPLQSLRTGECPTASGQA